MDRPSNDLLNRSVNTPEDLYLDLLKRCLTRSLFEATFKQVKVPSGTFSNAFYFPIRKSLAYLNLELVRRINADPQERAEGRDWPLDAETMVGLKRLDNLEHCITDVLRQHVPGDLIETGVWRGGATIFMRGVLKAYHDTRRTVWVADSFQGLPKPDPQRYPVDAGDHLYKFGQLKVSVEEVKANFSRYGLLDSQVRFLIGWFCDTLPSAPIQKLAVLRLDGDMYESTMDALQFLYPKLSVGGYVIIDDFGDTGIAGCRAAVEDFRGKHGITEPLQRIDWSGVFWRRLRE